MYGRYERRLATFVSWPLNAYVSAEALADAGLFYRGKHHLFSQNMSAYVLIVLIIHASRCLYFYHAHVEIRLFVLLLVLMYLL